MRLSGNGRSGSTRGSGAGNVRRCSGWGASPAAIPTCSSCGGRACGRRLECRSRMRRESHVRFWEGGEVQFPSATRPIVGFQHRHDAERFLIDLKERLAQFALDLHPEKTRLIEFGRYAAERRAERGNGKPETFDFLGFTHYCTTKKDAADFQLGRRTQRKRMKAKLREIKEMLRRHRHAPIDEQGKWLGTVIKGYFAYFAVPTNTSPLSAFRYHISLKWFQSLRRRSQRHRLTWERMSRLITRFLPSPRVLHPWPDQRFGVTYSR